MRIRPLPVAVIGVLAASVAIWLFPRAFPIVALEQQLTRDVALAKADSFFRTHEMAPADARTAVRFQRDDSLRTFVELAGGGADSLNALARGQDVAPYTWSVRAFVPGDPREARVDLAPDGRIIGFERKLAEADERPDVGADSARSLAEHTLATWVAPRPGSWTLVSTSYDTKPASGRVDRAFTFERMDRRIGSGEAGAGAPIRIDAVIAGDLPSVVRPYVEVPESFDRRYAEMRSWNDLLAILASLGVFAIAIAGVVALTRYARTRNVRWRPAMVVGGTIGAFAFAAGLNEMPGSWFGYDTAMSPATFRAIQLLLAFALGLMAALMTGFTLAAAEAATRQAFPRHLDWWKLWRHRGTNEVAASVGGGYAVAAIAFAYVALFYLVTRTLFGWWVPSELLDDPNQIASPVPWISGIAISLNAAVWEEALFRALPLSLLSLWVGQRPGRARWMAAGIIVSALIFGFAHANYESWPPYSRGVEIFLDAAFWAVLFLAFGLLVTVVAHFVYDAVLFGIFAAQGNAPEYRVTALIILAALLAPAVVVLWRRVRQRGWTPAPEDARFAAWTPGAAPEPAPAVELRTAGRLSPLARRLALAAAVAGVVMAVGRPPGPALGPRFTADRDSVHRVADSVLQSRDVAPADWTRLTVVERDTLPAWRRFLTRHDLQDRAQQMAAFHPPAWWIVRYVHTEGTPAERTEEWRVRVWPDGRLLDVRHVIPESAQRDTADATARRRIALAALASVGVDTSVLRESDVTETARPTRLDVRVTYTDTSVVLPAGAAARAWVGIAGNELLVARRGIELPEEFLREDRSRETNRMLIAGAGVLLLVALVITGALLVKKRRAIVVDDARLGGRALAIALAALIALAVLNHLNSLPSLLYSYDTAQPWSTFIGATAASLVGPIVLALVLFGLWFGVGGLRRRVGVPMLPPQPTPPDRKEMLIAGLGIGGVAHLAGALPALAGSQRIPPPPATVLDSLVPWLAGVPDVPLSALGVVVLTAIPLLVIAGLTSRWPLRVAISAVPAAIVVFIVWSRRPEGDVNALRVALNVLGLALGVAGLIVWGARFAWSWIVAGLTLEALGGLRDAAYGTVWQPRVAGMLVFLFAAALIALIAQRATAGHGSGEPASTDGSAAGGALPASAPGSA